MCCLPEHRIESVHSGSFTEPARWQSIFKRCALVPLAKDSGGLLLMSVSIKAVVLGAAATLVLCAWWWNRESTPLAPQLASNAAVQQSRLEDTHAAPLILAAGTRELASTANEASHAPAAPTRTA